MLKDRVLYIYKASEDVVALDTIPVLGYQVQTFQEVSYVIYSKTDRRILIFYYLSLSIGYRGTRTE